MTVRQNLRFLCRLYTEDDGEMERRIEEILHLSELTPYRDVLWKEVPSTHKPRLKFAVMAALKCDVLLLDGIPNPQKESMIHEALQKRMREVSTLIALPNLKSLRRYCDAGIVIRGKKLHYFDRIKEAIKYYRSEIRE
jgi:capsular polysaccharide transport system ATP-binding protein